MFVGNTTRVETKTQQHPQADPKEIQVGYSPNVREQFNHKKQEEPKEKRHMDISSGTRTIPLNPLNKYYA